LAAPFSWTVIAIVANAAACIGWVWIYLLIKRHLQSRHPVVFNRFRYPVPPGVSANDEEAEVKASFALGDWLRSGDWRRLDDPFLAGLVKARRVNFWVCCATLTATAVAILGGW
jgi:hypothetical protein